MSPDAVGLEILTVRYAPADEAVNVDLWREVNEQHLPLDVRGRLAANGFRVGVIGGHLPSVLERLLDLDVEAAPPADAGQAVDLSREPVLRRRALQLPAGQPARIITSGEQVRHPEWSVFAVSPRGEVTGRTYAQAMGLLTVQTAPQRDGRVQLQLVPEIEYGPSQRMFVPRDQIMAIEFRPAHVVFEDLRLTALMTPGEMLIVGCLPDRPGSIAERLLTEKASDQVWLKLVVVRLAQTQIDGLVDAAGL
jgi:hypothetical protein